MICPLCQDEVKSPASLKCPCKDTMYCTECLLSWRLPMSPPWDEDAFVALGRRTFAAPCPTCRSPLEMGMGGVDAGVDAGFWEPLATRRLSILSVMCMAVMDQNLHEVFGTNEFIVSDETLVSFIKMSKMSDTKFVDAVVHYVLRKNSPFEVLEQVIKWDSIDDMTRFLKYVGGYETEDYVRSVHLASIMPRVMESTVKWLSPDDVPYTKHCAFVEAYAMAMMHRGLYKDKIPILAELLRTSRHTGTREMQFAILAVLDKYDDGPRDKVAGLDAIGVVALYLDEDELGRRAANILKFKTLDASILPHLFGMSCRRKYLTETCTLVNKIRVPPNAGTNILEQIMRHIKWPVRCAASSLQAIDSLITKDNAGLVCEGMGHLMQLWMRCPSVTMDHTLEMIKVYMRECEVSDYE